MTEADQNVQLQNIISDKEERIRLLDEEIRELQSTITSLTLQLKSKDDEIKMLKEKICKKEKEKKNLKKSVKKFKKWVSEKDSQISKLHKSNENNKIKHDDEMKKLKEDTSKLEEKLEKTIETLRKRQDEKKKDILSLQKLEKENVSLKQQNDDLTSKLGENHSEIILLKEENDRISKSSKNPLEKYYLCIGQMCALLQKNMYHYVLPDEYAGEEWGYKVCDIRRDIEEIKDHQKRRQARERLQDLEDELNWENFFEGVIEFLQRKRNHVAHPTIRPEDVRKAVDVLNKEGKLNGKVNYERVFKIIIMYEKSVQLIKKN